MGFSVLVFSTLLGLGATANSSSAEPEDSGCHLDEITESYFCSSGPLEGREFLTKAELGDAIEAYKAKAKDASRERPSEVLPPPPPDSPVLKNEAKKAEPRDPVRLKIMSWNMKALAGEGSDFDRAALILGQADVIALQEMDLHSHGKGFLNVIGNLIQAKTQEKICRTWVQGANGERQTYGFLWKETSIGYVDAEGTINESCAETGATVRQTKKSKLASQATFYFKAQRKMFTLATIFMDKKPKTPEKAVTDLFKSLDDANWPVVLTGDLKMSPGNPAFNGARKLGFHAAIGGKSVENVWYRGVAAVTAGPVDLYREFSDARKEDIQKDFSGIFPVLAEFNLGEYAPVDSVAVIVKDKAPPKKKKKVSEKGPARKSTTP